MIVMMSVGSTEPEPTQVQHHVSAPQVDDTDRNHMGSHNVYREDRRSEAQTEWRTSANGGSTLLAFVAVFPDGSWTVDGTVYLHGLTTLLPFDLTPGYPHPNVVCRSVWHVRGSSCTEGPWYCTRGDGHTGRHAAGDGDFILAVWR